MEPAIFSLAAYRSADDSLGWGRHPLHGESLNVGWGKYHTSPLAESDPVLPMPTWLGYSEGLGKHVNIGGMLTELARLSVRGEEA